MKIFFLSAAIVGAVVPLNLLVGLSCALPAYLFAMELGRRERAEG